MIAYLLKSSICLAMTFGFYKVCLENEQMHCFKRFYLLGSLLFSILIPLVSFTIWPADSLLTHEIWPIYDVDHRPIFTVSQTTPQAEQNDAILLDALWVYSIVTAVMLGRFARNLYVLARQISSHPTQSLPGATVVKLTGHGLPYTFLHYLFVSAGTYNRGEVERELLTHELTHIRQRHSLDVLFIELLLCIGWFNPLLRWFKRAIQLNHEFMADEVVNRTHQDVTYYQRLLLSKLTLAGQLPLTSTLTFQTTKQRLIMMTKHTKPVRAWVVAGSALMLFGAMTLFVSRTASAQVTPTPSVTEAAPNRPEPKADVATMEQLYGDKFVMIPSQNKYQKATRRKFSDLLASEKKRVELIPPLPQLLPTDAQINEWKNSKKYGIWIDDKRVSNSRLTNYSAQDFSSVFISKLAKNTINYGKHYFQIDLMTKPYYQRYVNEWTASPMLVLMNRKPANR